MGFHISWLAVRGTAPDVIRTELELVETAKHASIPDADILGKQLGSGWYLLCFNSTGLPARIDRRIIDLSRGAELVACVIDGSTNLSLAHGYANGTCQWQVAHDSFGSGPKHLKTSGTLPPAYRKIRDEQLAKEAADDGVVDHIFDIPVRVAYQITGFRHDQPGAGDPPYIVLRNRGFLERGYLSWLAVRGKAPDVVRAELGLRETAERQKVPEAEILGMHLETGWYLLFLNSHRVERYVEGKLLALSCGAELVSCMVIEGWRSRATRFADGTETWQVRHDLRSGRTHLLETGALPGVYCSIRESQLAKQAAERGSIDHVLDIPVTLAREITGYRYDRGSGAAGEAAPYVVLKLPESRW
jgi:hypothetical protein